MATEYFIACALPRTAAADQDFQVSLFISPTIRPDADSTLSQSRVFLDWAETARTALAIELFDQAGTIACEPLLEPIDASLWRSLFPPSTPGK